jgi:hypothetical protein
MEAVTMNIVVGSAFRNASGHVVRYLNQVLALRAHAGPAHRVRVIAAVGDSSDETETMLTRNASARALPLTIAPCDHGGPSFGSTEQPERLKALSKVGNAIFEHVTEADDVLVYVESDLLWDSHTIGSLVDMAVRRDGGYDVFAPLIFAGPHFYDIWGYRALNGDRFSPFAPYYIGLGMDDSGLTEVGSVGSCLVMRREVAQKSRIKNDYCLVGWCEDARANGFKIAVHSGFKINHP